MTAPSAFPAVPYPAPVPLPRLVRCARCRVLDLEDRHACDPDVIAMNERADQQLAPRCRLDLTPHGGLR